MLASIFIPLADGRCAKLLPDENAMMNPPVEPIIFQ